MNLLQMPTLNHRCDVASGILNDGAWQFCRISFANAATNKAKLRKDNHLHAEPDRIGLISDREGDQDIALKKL